MDRTLDGLGASVFTFSETYEVKPKNTLQNRLMSWLVSKVRLADRDSGVKTFLTAVTAVAIATGLRLIFDPLLESRTPYGFYVVATAYVAWRNGLAPGLLTIGLGAVLGRYLFDQPRWSFATDDIFNNFGLVLSLLIGVLTTVFCESLRMTARAYAHSYELAKQADARKDQFLAMLGHELRNPLAPIRNALYLLDSVECRDPTLPQLRETISCQVDHLTRMVNDLLDVSRITQGKIELEIERIDVRTIVDAAIDQMQPLIKERRHQVHVDVPGELLFVRADLLRMTQVIANLVNNAAKYTPPGGHIWVSAESTGKNVLIRVRDSGVGIEPEMAPRIFELFEQIDQSMERSQGGLGVGLALVRWLVELHGGAIAVTSPGLGKGCEFTVRIPAAKGASSIAKKLTAESAVTEVALRPLRILVVEDLAASATSLAAVLKLWKHDVEIRFDGQSGVETAGLFKPDVIMSDLGLPRMNGFQMAEEIRRLPGLEHAVLIAVSGYGQPADRQRSESAGFAKHFVKPLDLLELKRFLSNITPKS